MYNYQLELLSCHDYFVSHVYLKRPANVRHFIDIVKDISNCIYFHKINMKITSIYADFCFFQLLLLDTHKKCSMEATRNSV